MIGRDALDAVLLKVKEGLEGVEKQPANTEKYSGMDKKPATYGVVKRLRDNDMELHTDQQVRYWHVYIIAVLKVKVDIQ